LNMSGEDIGNVDAVQTEAEAIQRAEAFLAAYPERRRRHLEEFTKRTGRVLPPDHEPIYIIEAITEHPQGWRLDCRVESLVGATIDNMTDPFISVNRKTGETKFGNFRDE
jgi:hypothetical protein